MNLSEIITDLFHFRDQVYIWHLQTENYAVHIALGDFYEKLIDRIDNLVEACIAQGAILDASAIQIPAFANYDSEIIKAVVRQYLEYLDAIKTELTLTAIQNIVDDMSQDGNQMLYLLRLK